jgi:predicted esterase
MNVLSDLVQLAGHNYIFHPPKPRPALNNFKIDSHNVLLRTVSGDNVHCKLTTPYDTPCTIPTYTPTAKLLIFLHGNADDVSTCSAYSQWLADTQSCNVITADYPGYGFSSGNSNTSEENMCHTAEAMLEFATNKLQHNVNSIIVVGKSLGTISAIYLASQHYSANLCGLVLFSPLASGVRCVFSSKIPLRVCQALDCVFAPSINRICDVESPIFIVHGIEDELVPIRNAHALVAACKTKTYYPPLFVGAGHNDIEAKFGALVIGSMQDFMQFCIDRVENREKAQSQYIDSP